MFRIGQKKSIEQLKEEIAQLEKERENLLHGGKITEVPGAGAIRIRDSNSIKATEANWKKLQKLKKQLHEELQQEANSSPYIPGSDQGVQEDTLIIQKSETQTDEDKKKSEKLQRISQELRSMAAADSPDFQYTISSLLTAFCSDKWGFVSSYAASKRHVGSSFYNGLYSSYDIGSNLDVGNIGYVFDFVFGGFLKPGDIILSANNPNNFRPEFLANSLCIVMFEHEGEPQVDFARIDGLNGEDSSLFYCQDQKQDRVISIANILAIVTKRVEFGSDLWHQLNIMPNDILETRLNSMLQYYDESQRNTGTDYSKQIQEIEHRLKILEQATPRSG